MNNYNFDYIIHLKNNLLDYKFKLLSLFLADKWLVNYKVVNLLIFKFFYGKIVIHWADYVKYFLNNNDFTLIFQWNLIWIKNNQFQDKNNNFSYELSELEHIYNNLILLDNDKIAQLYNKIF